MNWTFHLGIEHHTHQHYQYTSISFELGPASVTWRQRPAEVICRENGWWWESV